MLGAALGILLIVHGAIHLAGFAKSVRPERIPAIKKTVGKITGLYWLATCILFFISSMLLLLKTDSWLITTTAGILLSQFLIITHWSDAKYGTLLNFILLPVLAFSFGNRQFNQMVKQETDHLISAAGIPDPIVVMVTESQLNGLPPVVQKWLRQSGVLKQVIPFHVQILQSGSMRTKPNSDSWMPFTAAQVNTIITPGFIWYADVNMFAGIGFKGRDKLVNGQGNMLIKFLSLIPVVHANGKEINQGSMIRNLAEICWIPSMAVLPYIQWKQSDSLSAIATMTINNESVSGTFYFNNAGENIRFEAQRYYDRKEGATLEHWVVDNEPQSIRLFNGIRVPTKSTITWKLKEGDFTWLNLTVEDITYQDANSFNAFTN